MISKAIWCITLIGLTSQSACTGNSGGDQDVDDVINNTAGNDKAETELEGPLMLGKLTDDNVKQAIHDALNARFDGGDPSGAVVEIGDIKNFAFTVVKMTAGKDDVSGGKHDNVDGLEVEVTGWLRRIGGAGTQGDVASDACTSFDSTVPVKKDDNGWAVPARYSGVFSREDQEDCF